MKLIYKLINKSKLFEKIICIGALFSLYANSATVNMNAAAILAAQRGNYQFNNAGGAISKWNKGVGAANILTAATLRSHLLDILNGGKDIAYGLPMAAARNTACVREIARMLLAQMPAAVGRAVPHNVGGNNSPAYTIAAKIGGVGHNCDDIHLECIRSALFDHLINHGHLGYFPVYSHKDHSGVSNNLISRGIFNIDIAIMNRVNKSQKQIYSDFIQFLIRNVGNFSAYPHEIYPLNRNINDNYLHLFPNIIESCGYKVDPYVSNNQHPNLEDAAHELINQLLSTNNIAQVVIGQIQNNNRFTIDVTYNFLNPIPGVTQTNDIGYNLNGNTTNTVKIVVQVLNGVVSIVTMYPI